ncbi:sensor histidine kinase [Streptomyces sp. HD1123-B1]|uniref:sensor histidine kinase n=1 Tax=Streptomyces huangiella TaxID=3228804 RepID=UPI003D7DEDBA
MNPRHWLHTVFVSGQPAPVSATASRYSHRPLLLYFAAVMLTALIGALGGWTMFHGYGAGVATAVVLAVAQSAPLLLAVTRPLQAWWIMMAADLTSSAVLLHAPRLAENSWPWPPAVILGQLVLLAAVARRERRPALVTVWVVLTTSGLAIGSAAPHNRDSSDLLLSVLGGGILLVGGALRERHEALQRLGEQRLIAQSERARHTLLEERARIARELHDVVAHHMSVITVQADSAPYRIHGTSAAAQEEFAAIAVAARHSLSEMRMLLGVLRSDDSDDKHRPQPGLDDVPRLVEAIARAGVPANLVLDDGVEKLNGLIPPTVELSAYRIVQEALANVVRHAQGARTRVEVGLLPDRSSLTVLITNAAPQQSSGSLETGSTGHGLVGMRERVRLLGGALEAGPTRDGGFQVTARLPLPNPPCKETPHT